MITQYLSDYIKNKRCTLMCAGPMTKNFVDAFIDYSKNKKFMPPKATWFEPKPLDGLFFYNILDG